MIIKWEREQVNNQTDDRTAFKYSIKNFQYQTSNVVQVSPPVTRTHAHTHTYTHRQIYDWVSAAWCQWCCNVPWGWSVFVWTGPSCQVAVGAVGSAARPIGAAAAAAVGLPIGRGRVVLVGARLDVAAVVLGHLSDNPNQVHTLSLPYVSVTIWDLIFKLLAFIFVGYRETTLFCWPEMTCIPTAERRKGSDMLKLCDWSAGACAVCSCDPDLTRACFNVPQGGASELETILLHAGNCNQWKQCRKID